ncbi:MAG: hypothetical protein HQ517_17780 [SAR324 cluster bacterium]|nr:hypothetical protein [SAR324 cluster bacterium]
MSKPDIIAAVEPVIVAFDELNILYYIGGSVASSAYGFARATIDIDMVSNINRSHIKPLVEMLEQTYYISANMILDAIENQSSFNLIHLETMLKVDVFILKDASYHKESFGRRRVDTLDDDEDSIELFLVSAEDIILYKLDWYRLYRQESERQWFDVLGVIKVQEMRLDFEYLKKWSSELGLLELLKKAFEEAGIDFQ